MRDVLRAKLRLLLPAEIRSKIEALGKQHKDVATELDVTPETISRWCSGALIQSRKKDAKMRLYFEREAVEALAAALKRQSLTPTYVVVARSCHQEVSFVEGWIAPAGVMFASPTLFDVLGTPALPTPEAAANSNYALAA